MFGSSANTMSTPPLLLLADQWRDYQLLDTGGGTVACAAAGASVCHVDASKGMIQWCRENAALSGLGHAPIRTIAEDCRKFVQREARRGRRYDAIILDPPAFGRGSAGEVW